MRILVTGGAGFIGSAVIRFLIENTRHTVLNIDALTYAGNLSSISCSECERYLFRRVDIRDKPALEKVVNEFRPDTVMHLAAETHVDRSIDGPAEFVQTNIVGTCNLLEVVRAYWMGLTGLRRRQFLLHHISTDEVFGDLGADGHFTESSPYEPSSPYSASKASSDHLVRAWHRTFGLPVIVTNCSNNYGPCQFPEKLIPLTIINALRGEPLRVYGDGSQVRDWLYVEDHAQALYRVVTMGQVGETYNIGGSSERSNLDVVQSICGMLEELAPIKPSGIAHYRDLIRFVTDRPGHDQRYAIDASKIQRELGWKPMETFESGLRKTVQWYLEHGDWWHAPGTHGYQRERLGTLPESAAQEVRA